MSNQSLASASHVPVEAAGSVPHAGAELGLGGYPRCLFKCLLSFSGEHSWWLRTRWLGHGSRATSNQFSDQLASERRGGTCERQ